MKQSPIREKIKKLIRLNVLFILLSLFGSGVFLQNGNIYAQESSRRSIISENIYVTARLPKRGFAPKSVTIKTMDNEFTVLAYSDSAKDILIENDIILDEDDEILPSENDTVPHLGTIVVVKVDAYVHTEIVSIPQKTEEILDPNISKGITQIDSEGNNGLKEVTIKTIFKNNTEFRKITLEEKVLVESVPKVVRVGTRPTTVHSCTYWNKAINTVAPKDKNPEKNAWMRFVMLCESGCDSGKGFEKYFVGSKAFYGLYQFTEYTFKAYGGKNIFDGYDQIEVVSRMYDLNGNPAHHWPACNSAFEREYNK